MLVYTKFWQVEGSQELVVENCLKSNRSQVVSISLEERGK